MLKYLAIAVLATLLWLGHTNSVPKEELLQKYANDYSQFITGKNGLRVHFRDQGARNGKVLVLLHGNSNSLHIFEPLLKRLKQNYRLISLDFPGHGLTGAHPTHKYGFEQLSEALELVSRHLKLDNYTLLGHSMGGWVAWRYAIDNQTELRSLILMSASGMPVNPDDPEKETGLGFKLLKSPIGPSLSRYTIPRLMIKKSTQKSVYRKDVVTDELIDTYWELLRHPENRRALAHRASSDREVEKADLAKRIALPTLLIWGEEDTFVYPSATTAFSNRIDKAEVLLLPQVGHMPMLEAPDEVTDAIISFLDKG